MLFYHVTGAAVNNKKKQNTILIADLYEVDYSAQKVFLLEEI